MAESRGTVREIRTATQARALAAHLVHPGRDRPVVVISTAGGQTAPFVDAALVARGTAGAADVYVLTGRFPAQALSDELPEGTQVYGGASRIYPVDPGWQRHRERSRLHFAYGPDAHGTLARQLTAEALAAAQAGESARHHRVGAFSGATIAAGLDPDVVRALRRRAATSAEPTSPGPAGVTTPSAVPRQTAVPRPPVPGPRPKPGPPRRPEGRPVPTADATPPPVDPSSPACPEAAAGQAEPGGQVVPAPRPPAGPSPLQLELAQLRRAAERHRDELAQRDARVAELEAALEHSRSDRQRIAEDLESHRERSWEREQTRFADPGEQFRFEVYQAWVYRTAPQEKATLPLGDYLIGPDFLDTLTKVGGSRTKVVDVVVEVLTNRVWQSCGREVHQLRSGPGGDDPYVTGPRGETCWRVSLQVNAPSARRLHYWQRPGQGIELSSIRLHDDFRP